MKSRSKRLVTLSSTRVRINLFYVLVGQFKPRPASRDFLRAQSSIR
ncbi:hypothetical protein ACVWXO_004288 [Bradyrhizobium sp. LM2.7]